MPQEGRKVQGCFTGQPPGTDFFYAGLSPDMFLIGNVVQAFRHRAGADWSAQGLVWERRWPRVGGLRHDCGAVKRLETTDCQRRKWLLHGYGGPTSRTPERTW